MKSKILMAAKAAATAGAVIISAFLLNKYEYLTEFSKIDNFLGMVPVGLTAVFTLCLAIALWTPDKRENVPVRLVFLAFSLCAIALFPRAVRGEWFFEDKIINTAGETPDISVYAPFKPDNQTAKLNYSASLRLTEDFPVMDGALALYPVYSAVAEAVFDPEYYDPESLMFTNTLRAYDGIISGERDVIFVAGAGAGQIEKAREAGAELVFTPIGKEAFVFLTADTNPVESLTVQEIRNIYSGKTGYWRTLGWPEGGEIIAFQGPEGSGSQSGLESIMGDLPIIQPRPLPDLGLVGTNSLMKQLTAEYKGKQPVLGYSFRFFARVMYPNDRAKLLKINGIEPTPENISSGAYPFTVEFYAVTKGEPEGNTGLLIDWLLSEEGQELIEKSGYAKIE